MRIKKIATARVRDGYFRIYTLLRREGWVVNHKWVYRLYREEGLSMWVKRPRRHVSAAHRQARVEARVWNACWSIVFLSDALFDGQRLRVLTVVDNYTRESLATEVAQGIKGEQVVAVLERIAAVRGAPRCVRVDNVKSSCRECWIVGRTSKE